MPRDGPCYFNGLVGAWKENWNEGKNKNQMPTHPTNPPRVYVCVQRWWKIENWLIARAVDSFAQWQSESQHDVNQLDNDDIYITCRKKKKPDTNTTTTPAVYLSINFADAFIVILAAPIEKYSRQKLEIYILEICVPCRLQTARVVHMWLFIVADNGSDVTGVHNRKQPNRRRISIGRVIVMILDTGAVDQFLFFLSSARFRIPHLISTYVVDPSKVSGIISF